MKYLSLIITVFLTVSNGFAVSKSQIDEIWVTAGQSNMGGTSEANPHDHVLEYKRYDEDWLPTSHNLSAEFGKVVYEYTGRSIGFVRMSMGGRRINCWDENEKCYGGLTEALDRAGNDITGFLWFQGESDSERDDDNPNEPYHWGLNYEKEMRELVYHVRNYCGKDSLPCIIVQTGSLYPDGAILVRGGQFAVAKNDPNCVITPTYDQEAMLHFSADQLTIIGRRVGYAAVNFIHGKQTNWGPLFKNAYFADKSRTLIHVEFDNVKDSLKNYDTDADPDRFGFFIIDTNEWNENNHTLNFSYQDYPAMMIPYDSVERIAFNKLRITLTREAPPTSAISYGRASWLYKKDISYLTDERGIPAPVFFGIPIKAYEKQTKLGRSKHIDEKLKEYNIYIPSTSAPIMKFLVKNNSILGDMHIRILKPNGRMVYRSKIVVKQCNRLMCNKRFFQKSADGICIAQIFNDNTHIDTKRFYLRSR